MKTRKLLNKTILSDFKRGATIVIIFIISIFFVLRRLFSVII